MSALLAAAARSRKAIVGGVYGALLAAVPIVDDGLKPSEVLTIIGAGIVGSGIVYAVKNAPKRDA